MSFQTLRHKLTALKLSGADLAPAAMAGGLEIESEAKDRAPVDTGTLKRDVHTEVETSGSTATALIGNSKQVPYAAPQEFGTSKMAAQPYLRPGLDAGKAAAVDSAGAAIKHLVRSRV